MEYAVYDCKRLFETRYGFLLVNAQQIVHFLLYQGSAGGELNDLWSD